VALFGYLLEEFFLIEDEEDRVSQSSELLTRFAGWFDISQVSHMVLFFRHAHHHRCSASSLKAGRSSFFHPFCRVH
jgi:hypothetical protein